jgi:hypothetical protein
MMSCLIPYPFRFNPWKHHLIFVFNHLQYLINNPENENIKNEFIEIMKSINSNYVDIYTGNLSPEQIIQTIQKKLITMKVLKREDFSLWINKKEFQMLTIPDGSIWVLREGLEKEQFIHVHPAKNSPNSIRIHGNSWKTAVVTKIFNPYNNILNLQTINEIRKKHLVLSPIKNLNKSLRLLKALKLFNI